jgi:hypothetical protein
MPDRLRPLRRPLQLAVRPFVAFIYATGAPTRMSAGVPSDEPSGTVPGRRPLRVIVAGGMSGSGIGVATFEQAVASQFATVLSRITDRGTDWESIGDSSMRLSATASALLVHEGIGGVDVIVISPGSSDILAFTSVSRWATELERLLTRLRDLTGPRALVIVTEVPDVASHVQVGRFVGRMLTADSAAFNVAARSICEANPKAQFVTLPIVEKADFIDGAFSYSTVYRRWGRYLGEVVAGLRRR